MAVVVMCHCASAAKVNLQSKRSSGSSSVVRLGPQHVARARAVRPSKRRCAVTRCEQMNGAAPEASVTCLGEALFGAILQLLCKAIRSAFRGEINIVFVA